MCLSGRGLLVGSNVPFRYVVGDRQLCALLVGFWWYAVMCFPGRGLVVGSYVPFW
jgi:hypothetical protein